MKKKLIEGIPAKNRTGKTETGYVGTTQTTGEYLIINVYSGQRPVGRYCMNTRNSEYACFSDGKWNGKKFVNLIGYDPVYCGISSAEADFEWDTAADQAAAEAALGLRAGKSALREICDRESGYGYDMRKKTKTNKYERISRLMDTIPGIPEGIRDWAYRNIFSGRYLFRDKAGKKYGCSNCGHTLTEKEWTAAAGQKKIKHNETLRCPGCGERLTVKKRKGRIVQEARIILMQPWNGERSVVRHFIAQCEWDAAGHHIFLDEQVRLTPMKKPSRKDCEIYYDQPGTFEWWTGLERPRWYTSNPGNRRMKPGYLYPEGIKETLEGTAYNGLVRAFECMAAAGLNMDFNILMLVSTIEKGLGDILEYLQKGKFYRLLRETAGKCDFWYGGRYYGSLRLSGKTIQDVFGIRDMQTIHRIRQQDGGDDMVRWMQFQDGDGRRISQETLAWLIDNGIKVTDINEIGPHRFVIGKMSLERIRNYVESQRRPQDSVKDVIGRWGDYLTMTVAMGKKLDEELIYRPKDLKQRHDEAVEDRRKLETVKRMAENPEAREKEAREMERKFPEAAGILEEIREKYEYASGEFQMVMPGRLVEIVEEGYALHHCGGSSDRYFNRICNRETYIGFCRRASEPGIPYYTIEFEPGGTIRQNRTYYDEETGIEEVRGFLKEWQREIRKRLTQEDWELARKSAELREKNMEELKRNRNTFVLEKLMEDFMEAI